MAGSGAGGGGVGETKVIYHLDEEETPYLVKIPVPAERITLGDFKSVLQRPAGAKYFFKSMDQDFGKDGQISELELRTVASYLLCGCWELNLGLLQEPTEPALQPPDKKL